MPNESIFGWVLGYTIALTIVVVVVALVVPILVLAKKIGDQAESIDSELQKAVRNTAALKHLEGTIAGAGVIVAGLERGRHRLGG